MGCELLAFDSDLVEVVISLAIIAILQVLVLVLPRIKRIEEITERLRKAEPLQEFFEGFKIRKTQITAIAVAIISAIALDVIYFNLHGGQIPISPFSIISQILFHPIAEEFVNRWLILGTMLLLIDLIPKKINHPIIKFSLTTFATLTQAIYFGILHNAFLQLLQGILLAILFMGDRFTELFTGPSKKQKIFGYKNNILPPIIAHATHNILINTLNCILKISTL